MKKRLSRRRPPSLLRCALDYASCGFRVFPIRIPVKGTCSCRDAACDKAGKHPYIRDWPNQATTHSRQIREWWERWPTANIGILTDGQLVVLDVDPRNGGLESLSELEKIHGPLPATPTARTGGGGYHYYFYSSVPLPSRPGTLGPGLDIQGRNKSAIAPPSRHVSGNRYAWLKGKSIVELTPSPMPDWMLDKLRQNDQPESQQRRASPKGVLAEGVRDETLFRMACSMRSRNFGEDAIRSALIVENRQRCRPPLSTTQIAKIARSACRYASGSLLSQFALNDSGNAQRFAKRYGKRLKWVPDRKCWIRWTGIYWEPVDMDVVIGIAAKMMQAIGSETEATKESEAQTKLKKFAQNSGNFPRLKAIEQLSRGLISISAKKLDARDHFLNVQNGTVDLETGELNEHRCDDYFSQVLPAILDPDAECPRWLEFLLVITDGDEELIRYLQRLVGYCLTGSIQEQAAFFLYGTGANGKTTFLEVLRSILGPLACQTPRNTLLATNTDQIRPDLARL